MEPIETHNKNRRYEPILDGMSHWPVYLLSKNRKEFLEQVSIKSINRVLEMRPTEKELIRELESTVYREQNRIKRNPWRVDPKDDYKFWNGIKNELVEMSGQEGQHFDQAKDILGRIVRRYTSQIAGNFKKSSFRFTREAVKFWFQRLLNGARVKKFGAFFRSKYTLRDKIQIVGKAEMLRNLAKKGTVVMVPTHFSNLDSVLIGWVIHALGMPAFIYGAGLNLFNISIFAYFMNSLGAYKVDRRKKSIPYLETLRSYSTLAIMNGAHSLFFPGGTRSRSGMLEKKLKRGLLSTAIEAQRDLYMEAKAGEDVRKIYIVPVTINYHFVLEAPELVEDYLQEQGRDHYFPEKEKHNSFQLLRFMYKFFTKGSNISVSIGRALDVMGNYVDDDGNSLNQNGNIISARDYFVSGGQICVDHQREVEYSRMMSQKIVEEYHRINRVFASHLVAFVAFEMWVKKYPMLDLFTMLRLPEEDMCIEYDDFKASFKKVRKRIFELKSQHKVKIASHLTEKADEVIQHGLDNVGIFHLKRPLRKNKKGQIVTHDLALLYYYHNRLVGYELEKYV